MRGHKQDENLRKMNALSWYTDILQTSGEIEIKVTLPMARKPRYDEDEEPIEIIYVSKSEIKRDAKALKELGEEIVNMTKNQRSKLPLDDEFLEALATADKITNRKTEGYRRQLQFIGKLLRSRDEEAIRAAMDAAANTNKQAERALQQLEQLRNELLGENSNTKINELTGQYPNLERQKLRQLVKKAQQQQKQAPEQTAPAYKELFQYLKEVIQS